MRYSVASRSIPGTGSSGEGLLGSARAQRLHAAARSFRRHRRWWERRSRERRRACRFHQRGRGRCGSSRCRDRAGPTERRLSGRRLPSASIRHRRRTGLGGVRAPCHGVMLPVSQRVPFLRLGLWGDGAPGRGGRVALHARASPPRTRLVSGMPPERREGRRLNARHDRTDRLPAGPAAARIADPARRLARSSWLVALGCVDVDGLAVELAWSRLSDTVLADFRDGEPRRIGTAVIACRDEPVFVPQPDHLDWLGYENRAVRILEFAVALYRDSFDRQEASDPSWSRRASTATNMDQGALPEPCHPPLDACSFGVIGPAGSRAAGGHPRSPWFPGSRSRPF